MPFFSQFSSRPRSQDDSQQAEAMTSSTASGHPQFAVGEEPAVGVPGQREEEENKTLPSQESQERGKDETNNIDMDTWKK